AFTMAAWFLVGHHPVPDFCRVQIILLMVNQRFGIRFEYARRKAFTNESSLAVTAIGIESVAGDRFPVSDHVRDNRYHGAGHLRKINKRIGNWRSDRDRLFSNRCNTHGKLAFSSVNNT